MSACVRRAPIRLLSPCWHETLSSPPCNRFHETRETARELFNNVATEMVFSQAGARQLAVDVGALMGLFRVSSQQRFETRLAAFLLTNARVGL